jgi:hypothetical protein
MLYPIKRVKERRDALRGISRSTWSTTDTLPSLLTVTFSFYVSTAMLYGEDWTIVATATDGDDRTGSDSVGEDAVDGYVFVDYWGEVTTPRTSVPYGVIDEGESETVNDQSLGFFVANDTSYAALEGEDFEFDPDGPAGPYYLQLVADPPDGEPGPNEVSLRCSYGTTLDTDPEDFVWVGDSSGWMLPGAIFGAGFTGTGPLRGTGESPAELKNSCELFYGGGATVSSEEYSADITVAIFQQD